MFAKIKTQLLVFVLLIATVSAFFVKRAIAEQSFPIYLQTESKPDSSGNILRRFHDPEAGVNCYTLTNVGKIEGSSGGYTYRINGESKYPSISCVKVK